MTTTKTERFWPVEYNGRAGWQSVVTLNEAAVVLGLSPETLRVQINRGKLRAKKVGPVWTVTPHEIERAASHLAGDWLDDGWIVSAFVSEKWLDEPHERLDEQGRCQIVVDAVPSHLRP
jgi:hypothetical protein